MGRGPIYWAMRATKLQLLVTFVAVLIAAAFFAARGLPPNEPMFSALSAEDCEQVARALRWGIDAETEVWDGKRGLDRALETGNRELTLLLLRHGADARRAWGQEQGEPEPGVLLPGSDLLGRTPLHFAAIHDWVDVAEWLITHGADVHVKDPGGLEPLEWAVWSGSRGVARLLVAHGADVNARDSCDEPFLKSAMDPLADADVVKLLIALGADVNAKDRDGRSPLNWAIQFGQLDKATLLIAARAEVNTRDEGAATPLHVAADCGGLKMTELLIANGAEVNARTDSGSTPLHLAAKRGYKVIAELLINRGADVNARDVYDRTPMAMALAPAPYGGIPEDHKAVAELLREHGAKE